MARAKFTATTLNVVADAPDLRDRYYQPALKPLAPIMHPPGNLHVLDQETEGACTGFGLAATINLLYRSQNVEDKVSTRMLYEMAKRYDEWAGEDYSGSSCRGAIKGWKNTGVCLEQLSPYSSGSTGFVITPEITADARHRTVGAYYRLRPVVSDFHAAINETGVIFVSARVHAGWFNTAEDDDGVMVIPRHTDYSGGHAFAIVGYSSRGFWVQNSWGESWGHGGVALWPYEDWAENLMDAWVVQLALPTPQLFDASLVAGQASSANHQAVTGSPPRVGIEEHFVHLDDGEYCDSGRYWSNRDHMAVVQSAIGRASHRHLLLYAHGGLNSIKASARRIASMKAVFLGNGIYPFHFMYDTGLFEELKDIIIHKQDAAEQRSGGVRDWFDRRIEDLTRKPGRALWREMKRGARTPFERSRGDGSDVLRRLLEAINGMDQGVKLHVVGHSTGAILQAHLLTRLAKINPELRIASCSLMAPASTVEQFEALYRPLLEDGFIEDLTIYNLSDKLELDDNVAKVYGKSLLYLVSRTFEETSRAAMLGMEKHLKKVDTTGLPVDAIYSKTGDSGRSRSTSHGGFDNDPRTMNDILKRILGTRPSPKFKKSDLDY
jgi:hypothetical protein